MMPSPSNGTPDDYSASMPVVTEQTSPPESSAVPEEDHKMASSLPSDEAPFSNKTPADSRTKAERRRGTLPPSRAEVLGWYLYGLCSYSIQTVLIPVIFPLIISQIMSTPLAEPPQGWERSYKGLPCNLKEMKLYAGLTQKIIEIHNLRLSPLEWVSASWAIGLIVAAPLLGSASHHMDHGPNHQIIAGAATLLGAVFCFPAGFIKTVWIFPPYVAAIVAAHVVANASHTRQLGLMVRGFTGSKLHTTEFPIRRAISSWLSLYGAAASGLGSAMISAFTYHMLSKKEKFVSLWVVSIFSGIKWLTGIIHMIIVMLGPTSYSQTPPASSKLPHSLSVFSHPHALGTLAATLLSSFTTMCIFTIGVLYLVGQLCIRSRTLLYFWLTYFIFPLVSLPMLHPLQHLLKTNAVKMEILGLAISLVTSGFAFYFKDRGVWRPKYVLLFAGVQGTSVGILHTFSRVLMMDCAPSGKEGAFAGWHSWITGLGMCLGFMVGSSVDRLGTCIGATFLAGATGIVVLMFGNVSDYGGALGAGHVQEDEDDEDDEKGQLSAKGHEDVSVSKEHVSV